MKRMKGDGKVVSTEAFRQGVGMRIGRFEPFLLEVVRVFRFILLSFTRLSITARD